MTGVVAVLSGAGPTVAETGAALADLLGADLHEVGPLEAVERRGRAGGVLEELSGLDVLVAVLPDDAVLQATAGDVISACRSPVVVTPRTLRTRRPLAVSRVLLPLDGSWETAAAVAPTAALLADAGVDLVVLHVFDQDTVPRFWDQPAHARDAWEPEFLARYCPHRGVRLQVRTGAPGTQVVTVAREKCVDLIVLGWSGRLEPGRAATVRRAISEAHVPVMLMPVCRALDVPSTTEWTPAAPGRRVPLALAPHPPGR